MERQNKRAANYICGVLQSNFKTINTEAPNYLYCKCYFHNPISKQNFQLLIFYLIFIYFDLQNKHRKIPFSKKTQK